MPDSIGTTQLKEPAVGSANIYDEAVYEDKIKNYSVSHWKIRDLAVDQTKLLYPPVFGRSPNITARGTYIHFDTAGYYSGSFIDSPTLVVTPEGVISAVLDHQPAHGSAKIKLVSAGTEIVDWIVIGLAGTQ
jgi:hypothetical protein